jgi:plasmid stabilization system protein ParE
MNPSLGFWFHEDAALDIEESVAFYRYEAGVNVATSFVDEVERVLGLLSQNSSLGRRVTNKVRKFGLTTFPYSVVYWVFEGELIVLAVAHHSRKPNYWRNRQT